MNVIKLVLIAIVATACVGKSVKLEPIHVEPIHMTIDVNIHDPNVDPQKKLSEPE